MPEAAGFSIREVPTTWTDKIGSKMSLNKGALAIILSVFMVILGWLMLSQSDRPAVERAQRMSPVAH